MVRLSSRAGDEARLGLEEPGVGIVSDCGDSDFVCSRRFSSVNGNMLKAGGGVGSGDSRLGSVQQARFWQDKADALALEQSDRLRFSVMKNSR